MATPAPLGPWYHPPAVGLPRRPRPPLSAAHTATSKDVARARTQWVRQQRRARIAGCCGAEVTRWTRRRQGGHRHQPVRTHGRTAGQPAISDNGAALPAVQAERHWRSHAQPCRPVTTYLARHNEVRSYNISNNEQSLTHFDSDWRTFKY